MTSEMGKILFRMFSTRLFCSLSTKERGAVTEAIRLAVIAGGPVAEIERFETRRGLLALPWAWEPSFADVAPAATRMDHLARVEDQVVLTHLARGLAGALPRQEVRERLYRAMVALLFADGGSERDLNLLDPVRAGFDISACTASDIVEDLKDELVALVR